jgi:type 1 glutamine amidotransferase
MMHKSILLLVGTLFACLSFSCTSKMMAQKAASNSDKKLKVLIVDGQNNHVMWPMTTVMMKSYLEETGLFTVDVDRTIFTWKGDDLIDKYPVALDKETMALPEPKSDPDFKPDFGKYDVVLSNFGWRAAPWPENTQAALETYVKNGGGLVIVHAADNSWPEWLEFNKMIGLGGWGNRTEKDGPYVYYNNDGKLIRDDSPGRGGSHGPRHEYVIQIRDTKHPITKGMPEQWKHSLDELYDRLRGPAENMEILGTAYSSPDVKGTDRHEPMLLVLDYGKGRVFHTPMGHDDVSMECVGFIVSLQRGTEWAASGKVGTSIPNDFPTADMVKRRTFSKE